MPDPQQGQGTTPPIDISAGLVPKDTTQSGGIDLSAGLVPKTDPQSPEEVAARHARSSADALASGKLQVGSNATQTDEQDFGDQLRVGIGKEGVATIRGVANLANKVLPASLQIPTEQHQIETTLPEGEEKQKALNAMKEETQTQGVGETVGGVGENIAEWMAGDAALEGVAKLAKVAKNAPHLIELMEKFPKTAKMLMSAGKGAAVGGAQGAAKEGTLEGAEHGAEGGAAGSVLAETVGVVAKPILKSVGIGTESIDDAMRAAQPNKRNIKFMQDWSTAQPRLVKELEAGGKFKDIGEAADRIADVRRGVWDEVTSKLDPHLNETLDTTKVADSVRELANAADLKKFPEDRKFLNDFADQYESGRPSKSLSADKITVGDAEKEIERYNAKLADEGYWKKSPKERASMEKANPKIAAWRTASDQLRESLYSHPGVEDLKALKNEYGAIGNVENEVRGQVNTSGRQRPVSLKQIIGISAGLAHGGLTGAAIAALPIIDKLYNAPEELLNRAIGKSAAPGPVKQAIKAAAPVAAKVAKAGAGAGGALLVRFTASDGSVHQVNIAELEKAKQIDPGLKVE